MDIFIGFLGFTNDAVIDNAVKADISMLDESVLNALDIHGVNKNDLQKAPLSALELLVEEQKRKRKISNSNMIKRLTVNQAIGIAPDESEGNDMLNESLPDHFHVTKIEDALNESRPKEKN